jgi:hypothetical protein
MLPDVEFVHPLGNVRGRESVYKVNIPGPEPADQVYVVHLILL